MSPNCSDLCTRSSSFSPLCSRDSMVLCCRMKHSMLTCALVCVCVCLNRSRTCGRAKAYQNDFGLFHLCLCSCKCISLSWILEQQKTHSQQNYSLVHTGVVSNALRLRYINAMFVYFLSDAFVQRHLQCLHFMMTKCYM